MERMRSSHMGMIKGVAVEQEAVKVTMNLPFLGVPIRDELVRIVKNAIARKDEAVAVEVSFAAMTDAEREEFRKKAWNKWKS